MSDILARNLIALRNARGWTQSAIAEKISKSRVWYANLEGGQKPSSDLLYQLASVFEVKIEELLTEQPQLHRVRFRSSPQLRSREQILAYVGRWLANYREIEDLLGERKPDRLAKLRFKPGTKEAQRAAQEVRSTIGIGPDEPISNIAGLFEERVGLRLLLHPVHSDGFFGLSVGREEGGPAVVVNAWDRISVERWIFSAAHELGHLVLHLNAYDVSQDAEDPQQELEADTFAAYFLMPDASFRREWERTMGLPVVDRVLRLKRQFRVSYQTVLMRLRDEIPGIWGRFLGELKRRTKRSLPKTEEPEKLHLGAFCTVLAAEEPAHLREEDLMETRLRTLVRRALDQGLISQAKAAEALGLDIMRMRELADTWVG